MRIKLDHPLILATLAAVGMFVSARPNPAHPPAPPRSKRSDATSRAATPTGDAPTGATPTGATPTGDTPTGEVPGLWYLAKHVVSEVSDNDLMTQAAAMTFYTLLSIFPALAMLVSLFGLVADPTTIMHQVDNIALVLPGGAQDLLTDELKSLTAGDRGLGWAFLIGLATSLWTSNQAMKAMFNALNKVHEVKEKRNFFVLTALTLLCTFGTILFMVVAMAGIVVVPAVLAFVGLSSMVDFLLFWLRWPLLLGAIGLLLAVMFRFGPCRTKVVWRWISWGSGFAAVGWLLVSVLFSWYVSNFGNYNATYGSLGALVGFMTWIWISSLVVLVGAQLDAELEKFTVGKQRSRRTHDEAPVVVS